MNVKLLANLLDGFDALERFECYAGLEFGFVSSSFCFHLVWFRFGLIPAPCHHNHSLAIGPIFGVHLKPWICHQGKNHCCASAVLAAKQCLQFESLGALWFLGERRVLLRLTGGKASPTG